MVFVTSLVLFDFDDTPLDDECSLCGAMTPWLVSYRFRNELVNACLDCVRCISATAVEVNEQRLASQA
jgi:hypothetical protein